MLAMLIEVVDAGNRYFFRAHSKKGDPQPDPLRVPRPGDENRVEEKASPEDIKSFFGDAIVVDLPAQEAE